MTDHSFTFSDRLTWLSWRADWRLRYAEASQTIRSTKREMAGLHADRRITADAGARTTIDSRLYLLVIELRHQRGAANDLMIERTAANEHKAEQLAERKRIAA